MRSDHDMSEGRATPLTRRAHSCRSVRCARWTSLPPALLLIFVVTLGLTSTPQELSAQAPTSLGVSLTGGAPSPSQLSARQVWFFERGGELKVPFKLCALSAQAARVATISADGMSLKLSAEAAHLDRLEVSFEAPLSVGRITGERAPKPCEAQAQALIIFQEAQDQERGSSDRLLSPQGLSQRAFKALLHLDSGALSVTLQDELEGRALSLALLDGGRVRQLTPCEPRSCLLTLSPSNARAFSAQTFLKGRHVTRSKAHKLRAEVSRTTEVRETKKREIKKREIKKREIKTRGSRAREVDHGAPLQLYLIDSSLKLHERDTLMGFTSLSSRLLMRLPTLSFELTGSLSPKEKLDASQEPALLPLTHPELVEAVRCNKARCTLNREGVQVFSLDKSAPRLKVQLTLKRGVERVEGRKKSRIEKLKLPIERCAVRVPELELLGGVRRHHLPIALARGCFKGKSRSLKLETWPPVESYVNRELPIDDPRWRLFDVVFEETPPTGRHLEVSIFQQGAKETLLGEFQLPLAHSFRPSQLRLKLKQLGLIDFIPTNQEATLMPVFEEPRWASKIKVVSHHGFYEVRPSASGLAGEVKLKSAPDARGQLPLRLSYTPQLSPPFELLYPFSLAELTTEARYPLRDVNLPLTLTHPQQDSSIIEVTCLGARGVPLTVQPGVVALIPYESRHSCRVTVNRAAIPKWAGAQHIMIKAGKRFKRMVRARHGVGTLTISVPTDKMREFERLSIKVGHDYASARYDFSPQQDLGAEGRYEVVLGDRSFSVSISTALPTGLYRFGVGEGERDNVSLSAGGLARLLWLYKEGKPFPLGIDFGVLGTEINSAPHLSFVGGLGFSVPVLNANTPFEASFNLHAWIEYAPTRTAPNESAWALLFGPSFAVGKFSTQL